MLPFFCTSISYFLLAAIIVFCSCRPSQSKCVSLIAQCARFQSALFCLAFPAYLLFYAYIPFHFCLNCLILLLLWCWLEKIVLLSPSVDVCVFSFIFVISAFYLSCVHCSSFYVPYDCVYLQTLAYHVVAAGFFFFRWVNGFFCIVKRTLSGSVFECDDFVCATLVNNYIWWLHWLVLKYMCVYICKIVHYIGDRKTTNTHLRT